MRALVIAHQGGWDEILLVAVPVALFALLLRMANRKATKLQAMVREQVTDDQPGTAGDAGPSTADPSTAGKSAADQPADEPG